MAKATPREMVLTARPEAYEEDTGEWVFIRVRKKINEICPTCGQEWIHYVTNWSRILGSGNSSQTAWENAAKAMGFDIS
jgi:hypothetical protein